MSRIFPAKVSLRNLLFSSHGAFKNKRAYYVLYIIISMYLNTLNVKQNYRLYS